MNGAAIFDGPDCSGDKAVGEPRFALCVCPFCTRNSDGHIRDLPENRNRNAINQAMRALPRPEGLRKGVKPEVLTPFRV